MRPVVYKFCLARGRSVLRGVGHAPGEAGLRAAERQARACSVARGAVRANYISNCYEMPLPAGVAFNS